MKTNKPNQKTQTKAKLDTQVSQTLTMNAAQDKKMLNTYLQFGRGCIQEVFPKIKNIAKYKQSSSLQRKNTLEKTKIKHTFQWLKIS